MLEATARRAAVAALLVAAAGCRDDAAATRSAAPTTQDWASAHDAGASAAEHGASAAAAKQDARAVASTRGAPPSDSPQAAAAWSVEESAVAIQLARGQIASLAPASGRGAFDGTLRLGEAAAGAPAARVRVSLAMAGAPRAQKRGIAYFRLAHALAIPIVPATVERALPIGDLAALLAPHPALRDRLSAQVALQNDGTVDAVVSALSSDATGAPWQPPAGRLVAVASAPEAATWTRWAESKSPLPEEVAGQTRAYVEMLLLDYLSGNVLRRSIWVCYDAHTLVVADNDGAFQPEPDREIQGRVLAQLRGFQRFPRAAYERLVRFDADAAKATFTSGSFEAWLLSPRILVALGERRATVLSLIEARIQERGESAVLGP